MNIGIMNNQSAEIDPTYAWPCSALTRPIAIFDELTRHTRLQTITFLPTSTTVAMLLVYMRVLSFQRGIKPLQYYNCQYRIFILSTTFVALIKVTFIVSS